MIRSVVVADGDGESAAPMAVGAELARRTRAPLRTIVAPVSGRGRVARHVASAVARNDSPVICVVDETAWDRRPVFGTVASAVLAGVDAALVLVGPRCDERRWAAGTNLFVCLDGSALSEVVLPVAADMASTLGLALSLLRVAAPTAGPRLGSDVDPPDVIEGSDLARVAAALRRGGHRSTWEVLHGRRAAPAVVDHAAANGAALLALASHGLGHNRGELGRVARRVVADSSVPVLLTPARSLWQAVLALADPPVPLGGSAPRS